MKFADAQLLQALDFGLKSSDESIKARAHNMQFEQGVSESRRVFFESKPSTPIGNSWDELLRRHVDYVRLYVKTSSDQPHTFQDPLEPNDVGEIDQAQLIVRLEGLARPMKAFGCSFAELLEAHEAQDVDFLSEFCNVWNDMRDLRPAFSTLLSEVTDTLQQDDWADALRDMLGLAHYAANAAPEPIALCKYSVDDVHSEAKTGTPITMPTVLDSEPWEHYFPAPKSLQFGRAMALLPCDNEEDLKVELLNSRVTYTHKNIWKLGQIVRPAPSFGIGKLRELHLLALQLASGDVSFGAGQEC
jgi:hypothetical protein